MEKETKMKYQKFILQITVIENGKRVELEPLTYEVVRSEMMTNPFTGKRETAMECKCVETGEPFYITDTVCKEFENEGYLKVIENENI